MGSSVAFGCALELSGGSEVFDATVVMELFSDPKVVGCSVAFCCTLEETSDAEVVDATVSTELVCDPELVGR